MFQIRLNVAKYIEKIYLDLQFNTKSLGNKRLHEKIFMLNLLTTEIPCQKTTYTYIGDGIGAPTAIRILISKEALMT